jgi:uncharacterized protein YjiS (DUF1127 family)
MDRTRSTLRAGRGMLAAPVAQVMFQLAEWGRRRQMLRAYGRADETLLRDIGLTPDDLADALSRPLVEDASDALLKAAVARAGNW